jgi:hypothetical protein
MSMGATEPPDQILCADGRLVVIVPGEPIVGFTRRLTEGRLSPADLAGIVSLVESSGFLALAERYEATTEAAPAPRDGEGAVRPEPVRRLDASWETISVRTRNATRTVRVSPAGWVGAPEAFRRLRERLLSLVTLATAPFRPDSFRVSATPLPNSGTSAQAQAWPFPWIDLRSAAKAPVHLTAARGTGVAEAVPRGGSFLAEDGTMFWVGLLGDLPCAEPDERSVRGASAGTSGPP